ncbi:hypothetical protein KIL84_015047 [Mauremys mutica]|uniref:Uncharacterized protein n=1 Tax=Mauremys mutica TaxID=74926 RepID=A0A9D3XRW0_9SAUR|nr:hypothetical protein KIL84_015047 [Mauremys mutica]
MGAPSRGRVSGSGGDKAVLGADASECCGEGAEQCRSVCGQPLQINSKWLMKKLPLSLLIMALGCAKLALLGMMLLELCFLPSWDAPGTRVSWWAWGRKTAMWVMRPRAREVSSP